MGELLRTCAHVCPIFHESSGRNKTEAEQQKGNSGVSKRNKRISACICAHIVYSISRRCLSSRLFQLLVRSWGKKRRKKKSKQTNERSTINCRTPAARQWMAASESWWTTPVSKHTTERDVAHKRQSNNLCWANHECFQLVCALFRLIWIFPWIQNYRSLHLGRRPPELEKKCTRRR